MKKANDKNNWDNKLDYLIESRKIMWNIDYLKFLDFGCGAGFLGAVLLPMLPEGSSYTGIDKSEVLINEARSNFADSGYITNFEITDIVGYKPDKLFDIAICQTVIVYNPKPSRGLYSRNG